MPVRRSAALPLVLLLTMLARSAGAATVTVGTDAGAGSLRQALADANDGDSIDFALATPTTITLTTGELMVGKDVTITGPGSDLLTISGADVSRIFHVSPGTTATIAHLTASHGAKLGSPGGGCIYNQNGNVTLDHVVVSHCSAVYGAGVLNDGESAPATMLVVDSTIADNTTTGASGGGIYNDGNTASGNATLEIVRSTISGNQAPTMTSHGGGVLDDADDHGTSTLKIHATTFSGNSAHDTGGGLKVFATVGGHATVQVSNTTFAGNSASTSGGAIQIDALGGGAAGLEIGNTVLATGASGGTIANAGGAVGSLGFNLASDAAGGDGTTGPGGLLGATTDRRNTDALLGPLADNGGPTATHLPLPGSPAIDAGKRDTIPPLADTVDQRDFARPVNDPAVGNAVGGDASDIGAVEVQPAADLAVTQLKPPLRITLKPGTPSVTKPIKVQIQNRARAAELVPDLARLAALVEVHATSLGGCAAPVATLVVGKPNKVPVTIKSKKKLTVTFTATFACTNDPLKTSKKDPGHDDFHWVATVHRDALGGGDAHGADDVCPRPTLPGGIDSNPDPAKPIKDKGCGGKLPDKTLGADVPTDVIVK
jgi:predicted outer membrane repeat protein